MPRLSKNDLKYFVSLSIKKFRQKEKLFLIEGKRLIDEVMKSDFSIKKFIISDDYPETQGSFFTEIEKFGVEILFCSKNDFSRLSDTKSPQGVAAIVEIPDTIPVEKFSNKKIVALSDISDPGNLGTILRTCVWFGYDEILLDNLCVDLYNPKVVRSSMGAVFHAKISRDLNFENVLPVFSHNDYKLYTADLNGRDYRSFEKENKFIILFANEANGPDDRILSLSDEIITIPKEGKVESLNVASAAAVILSRMV